MYRFVFRFMQKRKLLNTRVPASLVHLLEVLTLLLLILVLAGTGFWFFEGEGYAASHSGRELTWLDSLWWALVTATTVGYGDYSPQTTPGRWVCGLSLIFFGIGAMTIIVSTVATAIFERENKRRRGMKKLNLENHLVICFFPSIEKIAELINEIREDEDFKFKQIVLVSEQTQHPLESMKEIGFINGSPTQLESLERACIDKASHCIILARDPKDNSSDSLSLASAILVEDMNPEIFTVIECIDATHKILFEKINCNQIVTTASYGVSLMAQATQDPGVNSAVAHLLSNKTETTIYSAILGIETITFGDLEELAVKREIRITILGFNRKGMDTLNPPKNIALQKGDTIIYLARARTVFKDLMEKYKP